MQGITFPKLVPTNKSMNQTQLLYKPTNVTQPSASTGIGHAMDVGQPLHPQYKVEFDTNQGAGRDWINIVDKVTGKVVFKIPPELVRQWAAHVQLARGMNVDLKS